MTSVLLVLGSAAITVAVFALLARTVLLLLALAILAGVLVDRLAIAVILLVVHGFFAFRSMGEQQSDEWQTALFPAKRPSAAWIRHVELGAGMTVMPESVSRTA